MRATKLSYDSDSDCTNVSHSITSSPSFVSYLKLWRIVERILVMHTCAANTCCAIVRDKTRRARHPDQLFDVFVGDQLCHVALSALENAYIMHHQQERQ